jgi:hypothetical protein
VARWLGYPARIGRRTGDEGSMRAEQRILGTRHSSLWRMLGTSPLIFGLMTGIARASETQTAVSPTRLLIARICRPRRQGARAQQTRFDHRTKTEHRATILLPKPVAAHDTSRHVTEGPAKIFKENRTLMNWPSLAVMAVTEFRVRCIQPLYHLSGARKGAQRAPIGRADMKNAPKSSRGLNCSGHFHRFLKRPGGEFFVPRSGSCTGPCPRADEQ